MGKKNIFICENQISLFDILDDEALNAPEIAISMFNGQEYTVYPLKSWMANLLPQGEYYILSDKYTLVLCKTDEDVLPEMKYRHYKIGGFVYAATGVGIGEDEPEEESECCDEE